MISERVDSVVDTAGLPALRRLATLDGTWVSAKTTGRAPGGARSMGYQPSLDGLRAISVIAVMLYHAGFGWMSGGFFGVEVFFVVSGYLITSLLLDEREKNQRVSLEHFWLRRARRLFPALATMLVTVAVWGLLFGSPEQRATLRRDLPWSIFYVGNWGQIFGSVPYFSSSDPPLMRHLWSLAVEEQWYIIWPLVFVGAMTIGAGRIRSRGYAFVGLALAVMVGTSLAHGQVSNNALYLSTFTRSSGLLLGAGCAFLWRPWRLASPSASVGRWLDPIAAGAVALLVCILAVASLEADYVYIWLLAIVSSLSMVVIAAVVYPTATGIRAILGWKPLAQIGQRSYGLYLWHWPIFVIGRVYHSGSWPRFLAGMAVTVAISEASYRYIETPIRKGVIGSWLRTTRNAIGAEHERRSRLTTIVGISALSVVVVLVAAYASVDHFDQAKGGQDVEFVAPGTIGNSSATSTTTLRPITDPVTGASVLPAVAPVTAPGGSAVSALPTTTTPATTTTLATLPRRVVVVGDSQAHSLAINLPDGIDSTFRISDGSVEGCGVFDTGKVISARSTFNRSFGNCKGWAAKWGSAAASADAQVALVVVGAWDVFDLELADRTLTFATADSDAYYLAQLQTGIDALIASGAQVALLEVPCMRPVDVKGAGVPALPERGDDTRTGHVNDLLRQAATADPAHVTFVPGPAAWCNDKDISTDLGYRWDGVHVYKLGANLIYGTIAQSLLNIPVP
ncbi:MAG: acyltransferase family protein [Ilumatobacteraceae bacterium]